MGGGELARSTTASIVDTGSQAVPTRWTVRHVTHGDLCLNGPNEGDFRVNWHEDEDFNKNDLTSMS